MESFTLKILCAVVLLTISIVFGVLLPFLYWRFSPKRKHFCQLENGDQESNGQISQEPHNQPSRNHGCFSQCFYFMKRKLNSQIVPNIIHCVCGGVFLGVSILDLFPESKKAVAEALALLNKDTQYPIAEFMITVGLLFVMVVENLMSVCVKQGNAPIPHHDSMESLQGMDDIDRHVSTYRMFILVVTLSFHSIFEGLAIGLQKDVGTIYQLAIAISVHKAVLTFGVGLPLFETMGAVNKLKVAIGCAMIFCCASPIGCIIGAFVTKESYTSSPGVSIATAVLQCLATGTFLYVTFLEVLPKEFSNHHHGHHSEHGRTHSNVSTNRDVLSVSISPHDSSKPQMLKLLALIAGFSIAAVLQFLA